MSEFVFKRYEIKFFLTPDRYETVRQVVENYMQADQYGETTIQSLYYDTPSWLLVRNSIEKPSYKEKLRLRGYGLVSDDEKAYLELKKKSCGVVYKRRIKITPQKANAFLTYQTVLPPGQIENELTTFRNHYKKLSPKILLLYDRTAYFMNDSDFRITFDKNIRYRTDRLTLSGGIDGISLLPGGTVLMEIKTSSTIPLWLVQVLSETKTYKTSFSKYGQAYLKEIQKNEQLIQLDI